MTLAGCHWLLLALTISSHWLSFALTGSHWPSPLALIIGPQALLKAAARDVYHTSCLAARCGRRGKHQASEECRNVGLEQAEDNLRCTMGCEVLLSTFPLALIISSHYWLPLLGLIIGSHWLLLALAICSHHWHSLALRNKTRRKSSATHLVRGDGVRSGVVPVKMVMVSATAACLHYSLATACPETSLLLTITSQLPHSTYMLLIYGVPEVCCSHSVFIYCPSISLPLYITAPLYHCPSISLSLYITVPLCHCPSPPYHCPFVSLSLKTRRRHGTLEVSNG